MSSSGPSEEFDVSTTDLDSLVQDTDFFRSLVENGSDAIVSIDETSTIIYANQSVERVFGYEPEALIGEKLTVLMPDRFHADHFGAVDEYLETGERTFDWNGIRLPAEHRDGHEVPLSITFEEHSYEGRRVFSGIMRDVTERVEREAELERQNERLERFASIVSHDLRDPLQTARAMLTVARAGDEAALDELDAVFDRMDELIGDVLTLAKQGRDVGDPERVALGTVVEDAWSTAGAAAATLDTCGDLPILSADPERLRTLLENLFRNAVDHAGPDVRITVGTLDGRSGFYVKDDGPGFGDADTDALFDYGYTTDEDGTGFGLSIVDDVARAHGWRVEATRATGGGARFEVETR
jgi:PAS domain S-box-containing protein